MYDRNEDNHVMSFSDLSNFDVIMENEPVRMIILDRLDNNGLHTFLRDYRRETGMDTDSHETGNQYYDIKEFNTLTSQNHPTTNMMHRNIMRLTKNKGKLLRFLSNFKGRISLYKQKSVMKLSIILKKTSSRITMHLLTPQNTIDIEEPLLLSSRVMDPLPQGKNWKLLKAVLVKIVLTKIHG